MGLLLAVSTMAGVHIIRRGMQAHHDTVPKLLMRAMLLTISVVPPDLPTLLSVSISTALSKLKKKFVLCTTPAALPACGRARVVAFDKTGTLTLDASQIVGVFAPSATLPSTLESSALEEPLQAVESDRSELMALFGAC